MARHSETRDRLHDQETARLLDFRATDRTYRARTRVHMDASVQRSYRTLGTVVASQYHDGIGAMAASINAWQSGSITPIVSFFQEVNIPLVGLLRDATTVRRELHQLKANSSTPFLKSQSNHYLLSR